MDSEFLKGFVPETCCDTLEQCYGSYRKSNFGASKNERLPKVQPVLPAVVVLQI